MVRRRRTPWRHRKEKGNSVRDGHEQTFKKKICQNKKTKKKMRRGKKKGGRELSPNSHHTSSEKVNGGLGERVRSAKGLGPSSHGTEDTGERVKISAKKTRRTIRKKRATARDSDVFLTKKKAPAELTKYCQASLGW